MQASVWILKLLSDLHCKRKMRTVPRAYIEHDILNFSMHNSTSTQNVLEVSSLKDTQYSLRV